MCAARKPRQEESMTRLGLIGSYGSLLVVLCSAATRGAETPTTAFDPDEAYLRRVGFGTDDAALVAMLKRQAGEKPEATVLTRLAQQLGDDDFETRRSAVSQLVALGKVALPVLRERLNDQDVEVARLAKECVERIEKLPSSNHLNIAAAVRLLHKRRSSGAVEALLDCLPYTNDSLVEEEIYYALAALGMRDGKACPQLVAALSDAMPARRAVATCILGRAGSAEQKEVVRKRLGDTDPLVRLRAAQGLLAGADKVGLPTLVELLTEPSVEITWQAEELLRYAAGDAAPRQTTIVAPVDKTLGTCQSAWRQWLRERGAAVDLERVGKTPRRPGLVLAFAIEKTLEKRDETGPAQEGYRTRLLLYGCDSKLRTIAEFPGIATQVGMRSTGNLVVIRQMNREKQQVTEVNRTGVVCWAWDIPSEWRGGHFNLLPSGGIVLFSLRQHLEFDADGHPTRKTWESTDHSVIGSRMFAGSDEIACASFPGASHKFGLDNVVGSIQVFDRFSGKEARCIPIRGIKEQWVHLPELGSVDGGDFMVRFLVPDGSGRRVEALNVEINGSGQEVWRARSQFLALARLRNGNMIGQKLGGGVGELDRDGRVVWEAVGEVSFAQVLFPLVRFGFSRPLHNEMMVTTESARIAALSDANPKIRLHAAKELTRLPLSEAVVAAVARALDDPNKEVRRELLCVLKMARHEAGPAVPALLRCLHDSDDGVIYDAVWILHHAGPQAVPPLLLVARDSSQPESVRTGAVTALTGHLDEPSGEAAATVRGALRDKHARIREATVRGLGFNPDLTKAQGFLPDLLALTADPERRVALACMGTLRDKFHPSASEVVPGLLRALERKDVRAQTVITLGMLGAGHPDTVPAILKCLEASEDYEVRAEAAWAADRLGAEAAKAALPKLLGALKEHRQHRDASDVSERMFVEAVIAVLRQLGTDARIAAPELLMLVQDRQKSPRVRLRAAEALATIDPVAFEAAMQVVRKEELDRLGR
jgi:HEAT repeat protein